MIQIIGVWLLVVAGILGLLGEFGWGWACFGLTGCITVGCAIRNKRKPTKTVSQTIQDFTRKKWIDYSIGSVLIAFCAWRHFSIYGFATGMENAFWILPIGLAIHFFANKD